MRQSRSRRLSAGGRGAPERTHAPDDQEYHPDRIEHMAGIERNGASGIMLCATRRIQRILARGPAQTVKQLLPGLGWGEIFRASEISQVAGHEAVDLVCTQQRGTQQPGAFASGQDRQPFAESR